MLSSECRGGSVIPIFIFRFSRSLLLGSREEEENGFAVDDHICEILCMTFHQKEYDL
jgi:hypothetical protein